MAQLDLPTVTLLCADCYDVERVIPVIEHCKSLCNFGAVKLLTSLDTNHPDKVKINPLPSHIAYSVFMLKRAPTYVSTEHALVVQHDGWILNPDAWNPAWLALDYVGPLFIHKHVIQPTSVGSGGFSLRSKKLMDFVNGRLPEWVETPQGTEQMQFMLGSYEDGIISIKHRHELVSAGFKYATPSEAAKFAQGGNCDPAYYVPRPFGFHGLWGNIDLDTGVVGPWVDRGC